MSNFIWFRKGIFAAAIIAAFIVSCLYLNTMWKQTFVSDAYLSCDEGFTYSAAKSIDSDGYFGFRCRNVVIGACYGGSQSFFDAMIMRAIPDSLIKKGEIFAGAGERWPWLAENQFELESLRLSRIVFIVLFFTIFPFVFGKDLLAGLFMTLLLTSSWAFMNAWSGMKNDFSSLIVLGVYLFLLQKSFNRISSERMDWKLFLIPFLVGNFGIWVRPVLLVPVFLGTAFFLFRDLFIGKNIWRFLKQAIAGGLFFFIFYILLHPNILANSMEAKWIEPIIFTGNPGYTREHFILELLLLAFGAWPFGFYLISKAPELKRFDPKRLLSYEAFLLTLFLATTFLTFKGFQGKAYYYLPVFFLALLLASRRLEKNRGFFTVFALVAVSVNLFAFFKYEPHLRPFPYATGVSLDGKLEHSLASEIQKALSNGETVWVDRNLRPNLVLEDNESRVKFFDSFVWNPSSLAKRLDDRSRVFFTCWGKGSHSEEIPSLDEWFSISDEWCSSKEEVSNRHFFPFTQFYKSSAFSMMDGKTWRKRFPKETLNSLVGERIHPRVFENSEYGRDFYEGYYLWNPEKALSFHAKFKNAVDSMVLDFSSDCKLDDVLTLEIRANNQVYRSSASLNVIHPFCLDFPKLCKREEFRRWSNRRYPLQLKIDGLNVKADQVIRVDIKAGGSCRAYLKPLQLVGMGKK